jgi:hypothetical protein
MNHYSYFDLPGGSEEQDSRRHLQTEATEPFWMRDRLEHIVQQLLTNLSDREKKKRKRI